MPISTVYAETVALHEVSNWVLVLQNTLNKLLPSIQLKHQSHPTFIYEDNSAAVTIVAKSPGDRSIIGICSRTSKSQAYSSCSFGHKSSDCWCPDQTCCCWSASGALLISSSEWDFFLRLSELSTTQGVCQAWSAEEAQDWYLYQLCLYEQSILVLVKFVTWLVQS